MGPLYPGRRNRRPDPSPEQGHSRDHARVARLADRPHPDFIPILGYFDDAIVVILILDYLFTEIPYEVLVDHFEGDPASLVNMRRRARFLSAIVPKWIKRRLWK